MSKNYYMPGQELSEEERVKLRETIKDQEANNLEDIKKHAQEIDEKAIVDFMSANFDPFEDRVLVYPDPVEAVTKSGIIKPEEVINKAKPVIGTVVAFGPGKQSINTAAFVTALGYQADNLAGLKREQINLSTNSPNINAYSAPPPRWLSEDFEALLTKNTMQEKLKVGDRVTYGNYAGTEMTINNVKYLIMRFTDIFGRAK